MGLAAPAPEEKGGRRRARAPRAGGAAKNSPRSIAAKNSPRSIDRGEGRERGRASEGPWLTLSQALRRPPRQRLPVGLTVQCHTYGCVGGAGASVSH